VVRCCQTPLVLTVMVAMPGFVCVRQLVTCLVGAIPFERYSKLSPSKVKPHPCVGRVPTKLVFVRQQPLEIQLGKSDVKWEGAYGRPGDVIA
jgi:hypothetical protein